MVRRGSAPVGHEELVPHPGTARIPHQRRPAAGSDSAPLSLADWDAARMGRLSVGPAAAPAQVAGPSILVLAGPSPPTPTT
jgi:hypothetical protein